MYRQCIEIEEFCAKLNEWKGKKVDVCQEEPAVFRFTGKLHYVNYTNNYVFLEVGNVRFELSRIKSMRFCNAYDSFFKENFIGLVVEYGSCAIWFKKVGWPLDWEDSHE